MQLMKLACKVVGSHVEDNYSSNAVNKFVALHTAW